MYTKNQFKIIVCLYENQCITTFKSFTLIKLAEGTELSIITLRKAVKMFVELGLIDKGMNSGKADTYYLTEKGINEYKTQYRNDEE